MVLESDSVIICLLIIHSIPTGTINNSNDIDKGWSVEIAFSWTSLRQFGNRKTPPKNADKWRINFSRVEWQYEIINGKYVKKPDTPADKWVWTPQYAKNMYIPGNIINLRYTLLPNRVF